MAILIKQKQTHRLLTLLQGRYVRKTSEPFWLHPSLCECVSDLYDAQTIDSTERIILEDYMRDNSPRLGWRDFWTRTGIGAYWYGGREDISLRQQWLIKHIKRTS